MHRKEILVEIRITISSLPDLVDQVPSGLCTGTRADENPLCPHYAADRLAAQALQGQLTVSRSGRHQRAQFCVHVFLWQPTRILAVFTAKETACRFESVL